jgi:nucleoside-diphosphate-sugar epimerase
MPPETEAPETFFRGRSVVVTGGVGFIGSNLVLRLVELGAHVTAIDAFVPDHGANPHNLSPVSDEIKVVRAFIDDPACFPALGSAGCIFDLAGQVSHVDSMSDPATDLKCNYSTHLGMMQFLRRANPGVKIVHTSTRQIYGRPISLPVTEDHPVRPVDMNGIHKAACETLNTIYARVHGFDVVSLRLTNTYGPRQLLRHDRQGFIAVFIRRAMLGQPIRLFGTGGQLRDMNYVDDAVEALLLAALTPAARGNVYNLGADQPVSLRQIVDVLRQLCAFEVEVVPFPKERAAIDIGDFYSDYSAIKKATGWRPRIPLADGLAKTVEFYRKNWAHYHA